MSDFTFKDLPKFNAALEAAVKRKLEEKVRPMFKGIVMEAAEALIIGAYGYAGTPQWRGNAAANWYAVAPGASPSYQEYFDTPAAPGDPDYDGTPSEFNGKTNQRSAATNISLQRIESTLKATGLMSVMIVNSAPQLTMYDPYNDSGPTFRNENHWPITAMLVAPRMVQRIKGATEVDRQAWRKRFS